MTAYTGTDTVYKELRGEQYIDYDEREAALADDRRNTKQLNRHERRREQALNRKGKKI